MNIFLITIAFLPFLFGYPSQKQALKACEEWESKGVVHFYESYSYLRKQWIDDGGNISSRVCLNKEGVNQENFIKAYELFANYHDNPEKVKKSIRWLLSNSRLRAGRIIGSTSNVPF